MSLGQLVGETSISQFMGKNILKGNKAFNLIAHFALKEILL